MQRFFIFENWILFSGIEGGHLYHLGVLEQRGKGHVSRVPSGGFGGGELKAKEGLYCYHEQGQYLQGESQGPIQRSEGREAADSGEGRAASGREREDQDGGCQVR